MGLDNARELHERDEDAAALVTEFRRDLLAARVGLAQRFLQILDLLADLRASILDPADRRGDVGVASEDDRVTCRDVQLGDQAHQRVDLDQLGNLRVDDAVKLQLHLTHLPASDAHNDDHHSNQCAEAQREAAGECGLAERDAPQARDGGHGISPGAA